MASTLIVNGQSYTIPVLDNVTLQSALRDDVGLTGTKFGCGLGQCGVCTVLVDGQAVRSCQVPVSQAVGKQVTTIEGLATGDTLHPIQQAWIDMQVPQCGYCQSGQMMEAVALLQANPKPTLQQIQQAMDGHLCRCGTYNRIAQAIQRASAAMA